MEKDHIHMDSYQNKNCTWTPTMDKKFDPHPHTTPY